jgi:HSP20 family molecular chaperone IbpA
MSLSFWNPNTVFAGVDDHFFDPLTSTLIGISPTLTRFKTYTMLLSSPRYEVTDNDKQFRLAIDVPGVKPDDMKIELEHEGGDYTSPEDARSKRTSQRRSTSLRSASLSVGIWIHPKLLLTWLMVYWC